MKKAKDDKVNIRATEDCIKEIKVLVDQIGDQNKLEALRLYVRHLYLSK